MHGIIIVIVAMAKFSNQNPKERHSIQHFGINIGRNVPGRALNFFFGGCVPRRFQNVGSRERIFLENGGLGNKNLEKFGSRELEFWPKHG